MIRISRTLFVHASVGCSGLLALSACDESTSSSATQPSGAIVQSATPASHQPTAETPESKTSIHFTDITSSTGIDFVMTCGVAPITQILEVNGGGVAMFDYDNDGDLDLFFANGATMTAPESGPGSRLYRNEGDLRFTDVTGEMGIDLKRWAMGVAVGDVDADGFEDLFIACYGPDVLLRNYGDQFLDFSKAGLQTDDRWGAGAAFGDLDNDIDLDLYVVNYLEFDHQQPPARAQYKNISVMGGPHGLRPQADQVLLNDGHGVFRDASNEFGMQSVPPSYGLNAVILDFDNDHWQDIIVANDSMPDFYFRNRGGERQAAPSERSGRLSFEEIGVLSGVASNGDGGNQASMGMAIGDVDGNGFADKFVTVFSADTNTLHLNEAGRLFEDRSNAFGLGVSSRPYLGWACGFFDFDHDGDEDLIAFNGHVYPEATMQTMESEFEQTPLLYAREDQRFRQLTADDAGAWLGERHRDRAAAFGDLDNDGDIDIVVTELNGPVRVLRNDAVERNDMAWLQVELRDDRRASRNRRGMGARIELAVGDRTMRRWLFSGGGYQSSSPLIAHFGLGTTAALPTIEVHWPDGHVQRIDDVQTNQRLIIRRSDQAADTGPADAQSDAPDSEAESTSPPS